MHRRRAHSTTAKPLGQFCTDGTTLCTGPSDVPFLNRTARRRDKQLRALGHTRMIYPGVGIVGIVCTITAPSSWKLFGPLCHQRQPCACVRLPMCVCAWPSMGICTDPCWCAIADPTLSSLPLFYSSLPHPPCQPAYLLDLFYLFSTFACPFLSFLLFSLSLFDENLSVTVLNFGIFH